MDERQRNNRIISWANSFIEIKQRFEMAQGSGQGKSCTRLMNDSRTLNATLGSSALSIYVEIFAEFVLGMPSRWDAFTLYIHCRSPGFVIILYVATTGGQSYPQEQAMPPICFLNVFERVNYHEREGTCLTYPGNCLVTGSTLRKRNPSGVTQISNLGAFKWELNQLKPYACSIPDS